MIFYDFINVIKILKNNLRVIKLTFFVTFSVVGLFVVKINEVKITDSLYYFKYIVGNNIFFRG